MSIQNRQLCNVLLLLFFENHWVTVLDACTKDYGNITLQETKTENIIDSHIALGVYFQDH